MPGAGAAGGLGAMLGALGAELMPGAELVLELIGFREQAAQSDLVITGEGQVDLSSREGKAPGRVAAVCAEVGTRCVVFGGRVDLPLPGAEMRALTGRPQFAAEDLVELGESVALELVGGPV
jgi:glycerate kinase